MRVNFYTIDNFKIFYSRSNSFLKYPVAVYASATLGCVSALMPRGVVILFAIDYVAKTLKKHFLSFPCLRAPTVGENGNPLFSGSCLLRGYPPSRV